ncbi:MAG: bifunctional 4-hydroxy-2-oxoglutarate aldolase/2-dehydro-3-deoxy-phosphogluconate aldolase [Schleiferiaceae bacterium]
MSDMNNKNVVELMKDTKVIPLFYQGDAEVAKKLVDACYQGGARVIEFTNRGEKAEVVFTELLAYCNQNYPELALGIGSIATVDQALRFIEIGAHFLVSPFIDEDLAQVSKQRGIFWTGGCGTLTELQTAYNWGVKLLKLFPGGIYGPAMIKNVKAPCPWLQIMPTGGVKPERDNLEAWFGAGASCVGMGSQLFVKSAEGDFDYASITEKLQLSIQVANSFS